MAAVPVTHFYVFTIFMLTLGPIKVIPAFGAMTRDATRGQVIELAVRGTIQATIIALLIAVVCTSMQEAWGVSLDAIRITGGTLLFMSAASGQVMQSPAAVAMPPPLANLDDAAIRRLSFMPISIPVIITPWGVVAIVLFMRLAAGDREASIAVLAILVLVMALNFVGMLFARTIVKFAGIATFQLVGWIFGILQCGLAVQTILIALRNLGVVAR
jgi:multiple antibiotic resistance protein